MLIVRLIYTRVLGVMVFNATSGAGIAYPPEHLSSPPPPVFIGVRVTQFLVLYVYFVDRCLPFGTFSLGHCVVCSSLTYGL